MRYLGIDFGSKRVGIALSDEGGTMGFPHGILQNTPRLLDEVAALITTANVGVVVMGESRALDGGENPIAAAARAFGGEITERTGVSVVYESEVFTSEAARQPHHKEEKTRAPQKHAPIDDSAAALILTSYLERKA